MKYLALFFFLLSAPLFAYPVCTDPTLSSALASIYRLPEGKKLIKEVEAKGRISIYFGCFDCDSNAMWVPNTRSIILNASKKRSVGELIHSIFFELHNAKADTQFTQLDQMVRSHRLQKEAYVEAVERLEHQNALQASMGLNKGIRLGLFPKDAKWVIPQSFETHYFYQKQCGHAQDIARIYDQIKTEKYPRL